MTEKLKKVIKQLPCDGEWYKKDNEEIFIELAEELLTYGLGEGEVYDFLNSAYFAVSSEYGN